MRFVAIFAVGLLASGCGDGHASPAPPPPRDAGDVAPDARIDAGSISALPDAGDASLDATTTFSPPEPPSPPAPAILTPCPPGWREVAPTATLPAATCEPYPTRLPEVCIGAFAQLPGQATCTRIGTECAPDGFPTDLPAGGQILYVRADAPVGGDGSRATPYRGLDVAAAAAARGAVIAVAAGTYDAPVDLEDVAVYGACASGTVLTHTLAVTGDFTLRSRGAVFVRNVRIESASSAIRVQDGHLDVEDVVISGAPRQAVVVDRPANFNASRLVVRDIGRDDGDLSYGAAVTAGGLASIVGAALERCAHGALAVNDTGSADLRSALVRDCGATSGDELGTAVRVTSSIASLDQVVVIGAGTRALVCERNPTSSRAYCRLTAADVVMRDNGAGATGPVAASANGDGAELHLERAQFDGNHGASVMARDGATSGVFYAVFRGTVADDANAATIVAEPRGTIYVSNTVVVDVELRAVSARGADAVASIRDVLVHGVVPGLASGRSVALDSADGAVIYANAVRLEAVSTLGALARGGDLSLEDVAFAEIASEPGTGLLGRAVEGQAGSRVVLRRVSIDRARDVAVAAFGDCALQASIVSVRDTRARDCSTSSCASAPSGVALGAYDSATVRVDRFVLDGAPGAGVQISSRASVDLYSGQVSHAARGANVQAPGFDLTRLRRDVTYFSNGTDFDSSALALPSPATVP